MKWCQKCGQRLQEIRPGEKCKMCGWVRPEKNARPNDQVDAPEKAQEETV